MTTTRSAGAARAPSLDLAAVDAFVSAEMQANRIPGLGLAITRGSEVVAVRGYGMARAGEPVMPRTQFRIASLSKSFTAVAVLQLVEAGQVELDRPVMRYLPDFTLGSSSGRYFGYVMLAHAMPDIMIWLGICGGLGALNGLARLVILARQAGG